MRQTFYYILIILFIFSCSTDNEINENEIDLAINDINIENTILDYHLKGIDFLDNDFGFAIDYQGVVFKTENSGLNWDILFSSNFDLIDIQFLNKNLGFVLGKNGNDFSLFKTLDGGISFQETIIQGGSGLTKIFFINSDLGFILGNHILKTENSGNSWNEISLEFNVYRDIIKTENEEIYISGLRGTLLKSNNYGNNWELKNTNSESHIYEILPFENIFYLIGQGVIKTDFNTTIEFQPPSSIRGTHIFDKTTLIGFGERYPTLGIFPEAAIFISNDSGENWETTILSEYSRITVIDFIDSKNGFALGENLFSGKSYLIKIKILK
jgi:photosystem II stability/assembly factor-like uncharacterized protein